ncbi:hypothetical protein PENTCL1PPCAC_3837, partial [Pristionchus entomophagus]
LGIITNCYALYLVITKSRKGLSEYKKLLIIFLLSDLLYTLLQDILKPVIVVYGDVFLVYSPGFIQSKILLCVYCGSVTTTTTIFAFHFVFRAFVISSKSYFVARIDWRKLLIMCSVFIIEGISWGAVVYTQFAYDP